MIRILLDVPGIMTEQQRVNLGMPKSELLEAGFLYHPLTEIWIPQRYYLAEGRYIVVHDP